MFHIEPDAQTVQFHIVLGDGFNLHDLAALRDTLEMANAGQSKYHLDCCLVGITDLTIRSSLGARVSVERTISNSLSAANVILLAGTDCQSQHSDHLLPWLRMHIQRGMPVIGIGGGIELLLKSDIAAGRRVAVHWQDFQKWSSLYSNVEFTNEIFCVDGPLISCAGGEATFDLILHGLIPLIGPAHSFHLADKINLTWLRREGDLQRGGVTVQGIDNVTLRQALEIIHSNYHADMSSTDVADCCKVTARHIQQLFRAYLRLTPSQYLTNCRLECARRLLRRTGISVSDAARAVGFRSVSHFSRRYTSTFGLPPRQDQI